MTGATPRIVRRAGRAIERKAAAEQTRRRRSGAWQEWTSRAVAKGEVGSGAWLSEIHTAYQNGAYAVLVRTIPSGWGRIEHASIHTLTGGDISWRDKQRIKNEIFGEHALAVEVFPPQAELIDSADAFHLWILPEGFRLPFSLDEKTPAGYRPSELGPRGGGGSSGGVVVVKESRHG
jgi:hypothetical protein